MATRPQYLVLRRCDRVETWLVRFDVDAMMRLWSEQLPDADQEAAESRQPYRAAVGVFRS